MGTEPSVENTDQPKLTKYLVLEPKSVEQFDALMARLGEAHRRIEALRIERDQKVAEIDADYSKSRQALVEMYNAIFDACNAFASNPDNKARMTTHKAPQTADLTNSKVKWTDDHNGQIELADGVTEDQVIRALLHRKGGRAFIKTQRSLVWQNIRSKANEATVLGMKKFFVRRFKPTTVALYIKPASTPKPEGKTAETQVKRLN